MPSLLLILTTSVLLAAPAKEEEPFARAEATLRRVAKLPAEQQRQWLRSAEQRFAWAALLTMTDDEAKKEQVRVAQILRQKTVAWSDMVELMRQLDRREKLAIARLVRIYRAEVLQNFRTRQDEMLARQDAWYRIWTDWEKAGSPPEQQDQLMDWLAAAIKLSGREKPGSLPPDPKFGDGIPLVPEQLVRSSLPPPPNLLGRGPLPLRVPDPAAFDVRPEGSAASIDAHRAYESMLDMPPAIPLSIAVAPRRLAAEAVPDARTVSASPTPRRRLEFMRTPSDTVAAQEDFAADVAVSSRDGIAKPQATGSVRHLAELPLLSQARDSISEHSPIALPEFSTPPQTLRRNEIKPSPELAENPHPPRENVLAMLPPSRVAIGSRIDARVERRPLPSIAPLAPPNVQNSDVNPEDRHAHINVEELAARIDGINLSLRTLEGELNEKRDYTADQLSSMLNRLDILVLRQKDLALFRDLITPQEQTKVRQIDSPRGAVAKMGTRIGELRTQVRQSESMPEAERTATLKQLDEVSDRLATMTAEK